MEIHPRTCLLALSPSGVRIKAWIATAPEGEALAEALHKRRGRAGWYALAVGM